MPAPSAAPGPPVVLFDGECGLCQACVRLLLRWDRAGRLRFAPLQSPPAQEFLRAAGLPTEDFDSLVFAPDWRVRRPASYRLRTDGLLAALAVIGGTGREVANLRALPGWLRDGLYRVVARSRHRLFGRSRAHWVRPEWADRFLAGP